MSPPSCAASLSVSLPSRPPVFAGFALPQAVPLLTCVLTSSLPVLAALSLPVCTHSPDLFLRAAYSSFPLLCQVPVGSSLYSLLLHSCFAPQPARV